MRFRSRRSINGVLTGLILVLITLLVLGIVTRRPVFYILFGVIIVLVILAVIAFFNFLKKTGQETSSTRRSTYDILEGHEIKGLESESEKDVDSTSSKSVQKTKFCESCGMKLTPGAKNCTNCGKKNLNCSCSFFHIFDNKQSNRRRKWVKIY